MKKIRLVLTILLILSLTGCIKEYRLTDLRSEAAAEYMAGLLLKYDKDYESQLSSLEELEKQAEVVPEKDIINDSKDYTATPTPEGGEGTIKEDSDMNIDKRFTLTEVVGVDDFDIQYIQYQICESYPEDTTNVYFSLTAGQGNQLLVAWFSVKNNSDKEQTLNLSNSKEQYQLDVNVGTVYKPLLTLLENDLQYIDITIKAGESQKALLMFEISKDIDISNINLIASKEDRTEIIEIK